MTKRLCTYIRTGIYCLELDRTPLEFQLTKPISIVLTEVSHRLAENR
jgi:hypothetical protein